MRISSFLMVTCIALLSIGGTASAQRAYEKLGRGLVILPDSTNAAFLSWRLLINDPQEIAFNVYRKDGNGKVQKLNSKPVADVTHFKDVKVKDRNKCEWWIIPVIGGRERSNEKSFSTVRVNLDQRHITLPLKTPAGYAPNDASAGDLDGDGEYDLVVHMTGKGHDNSHKGFTDPPILQGYKLDGTLLWSINLGKNIREGAHYTQFIVFDLDGDGRAEVACKTADGSVDGKGKVIGDANANYVNENGYILAGPEFLTVFDGRTGEALSTTNYIPARHPDLLSPTTEQLKEVWGDGYGNRMDRFLACVAYLDGKHPSLVMTRGYYTRSVLSAWDFSNKTLTHRWTFDSDASEENRPFRGQGYHSLSVGDVDSDGKDEVIFGSCVIDDNGKGLYSTGLGPEKPGLEIFGIQERFDDAGAHFRNAKTGEVYWKKPSVKAGEDGEGPGRGNAMDIDPRYPGYECWVKGANITGLFTAKGELISEKAPTSCNFGIWWDGDLLRELLDKNSVYKWDWKESRQNPILTATECASNNGTKGTPTLSADLFGDWREEVIWRTSDNNELHIYSTVIPTQHRFVTLMHDPVYRLGVAWQNVGYNQPPHVSFYLGDKMKH
jgi:rhamnogalacturonan endolyase